jgi:glycerophosphoryl diester phosphodiesterase
MDLVTEKVMDQARARGWQVYTWAPMVGEDRDRESWWVTLKSLGVDGHCTNYPREFRSWLESLENYQTRVKELLEHGISKRT